MCEAMASMILVGHLRRFEGSISSGMIGNLKMGPKKEGQSLV